MNVAIGFYEQVINQIIKEGLTSLDRNLFNIAVDKIDAAESSKLLASYLTNILAEVFEYLDGEESLQNRIEFCNSIMLHIIKCIENGSYNFKKDPLLVKRIKSFLIHQDAEVLLSILDKKAKQLELKSLSRQRPSTSIAENSLFTGALHEPSMVSELKKEILTSNQIDFLVSFIKWSGLRLIIPELREFVLRGKLRIITTSYLGATDYKAIEELSNLLNTEIRISYDTKRTRLHAKTYIFWRDTGFSTAYIGSSNISESAMTSGLEWNLKLAEYESADIFEKIKATFDVYWNSKEFVSYKPETDSLRLKKALKAERLSSENDRSLSFNFDIRPYHYQQDILDKLKAEREVHNSYRNLVVAATGTGKTVISAFDYLNFCQLNPQKPNRLLFVAHRKEILQQSLDCFRGILKDLNFGSLMVGGLTPESLDYLFVSIQSLNSKELVNITSPEFYDYIVIDEFHHAAAPSYQELLEYYKPQILLGLTATPERPDGKSIFAYFDNRIATEIRLYDAIDQKLLSPFHYFGVTDSVDLRNIRWVRGNYDDKELENVYVFEKAVAEKRANFIIKATEKYCTAISDCIGIGFCVTKKHAEFMANMFNQAGIPSEFLTADSSNEIRDNVKRRLVNRDINFVFVVDIYNEGVDIPEVNTVLFLRPTESLTVFLQQLGRGLRLSPGKEALTVLDFVGQAHQKYSFEERFKVLLGRTRKTVVQEIKAGFINVPKGCSIQLEKQAEKYILENIKSAINNKRNILIRLQDQLERTNELNAFDFYQNYHVKPQDVYGKRYTLTGLAVENNLIKGYSLDKDKERLMALALGRLSFANSRRWLEFLLRILPVIKASQGSYSIKLEKKEKTMLTMFYYTLWGKGLEELAIKFSCLEEAIAWAIDDKLLYQELLALLNYQFEKIDFLDKPLLSLDQETPLDLYCAYTLDQILVALGKYSEERSSSFREGVLYLPEKNLDVFFVTLNKAEKDYSPSTMYKDYSINEELFHWQSQSRTTVESPTGQRYINQKPNKTKVLLFVREYKKEAGLTAPYTCLGLVDYVNHYGSAPINIVWKVREKMPGFVLQKTAKV